MVKFYPQKEKQIPFTRAGFEKFLKELSDLKSQRPDAVEHLRRAREMGDLSENEYYRSSRIRLSTLDARIRKLEKLVILAKVIDKTELKSTIEIGSDVEISDGKNKRIFTIVGSFESDPSQKTISYVSPIGKALIGKKVNEEVFVKTPSGNVKYKILKIK